ncbi:hypothetical protein CALCODRAFT_488973 [Calocera cornea HHB12733]|uniref:Uncharacterized protein n=1 Tax=Calocera cornea HHB12733 TaxID=1353952 RepID=A0A165C132_9BASI|nr:hypothetical protein CALCODRAFT_488979 [Calocera cornea HHB12733]KZT50080.1 hypothetical protein CALCODRAFT_488973 [Calocera cornea HHB12733]
MNVALAVFKAIWAGSPLARVTAGVAGLTVLVDQLNRLLAAIETTLDRMIAIKKKNRRLRAPEKKKREEEDGWGGGEEG